MHIQTHIHTYTHIKVYNTKDTERFPIEYNSTSYYIISYYPPNIIDLLIDSNVDEEVDALGIDEETDDEEN